MPLPPTEIRCPFYGHCAVPELQTLAATGGNQCALITDAHAACQMEKEGRKPVWEQCRAHEHPMYRLRAEKMLEWAKSAGGELPIQFYYPD
jgi:hypothetical protein